MEKAVERPSDKEIEEFFLPDCADEAMANSPSMPDRCIGCPGRVGTEANLNAITMTTLDACKRRRFPFYCHMTRRGEFCTHLCADWVSAMESRIA